MDSGRKLKVMEKKLLQEDAKKIKKSSLEQFMKTYNYYIYKLLWSQVDPFLKQKHKQYQVQCESHRLSKDANVFNRLKIDTAERQITDMKTLRRMKELYDPNPYALKPIRMKVQKQDRDLGS